jgi:hypothetical protein
VWMWITFMVPSLLDEYTVAQSTSKLVTAPV